MADNNENRVATPSQIDKWNARYSKRHGNKTEENSAQTVTENLGEQKDYAQSPAIERWNARKQKKEELNDKLKQERQETAKKDKPEKTDWNETFRESETYQKAESLGYKIERFNIQNEDELKRALAQIEETMAKFGDGRPNDALEDVVENTPIDDNIVDIVENVEEVEEENVDEVEEENVDEVEEENVDEV
ncbi:MAG: hypothetical protein IJW75_06460, partial [Alphaproteobacteria bacterium]|nr:hypothetical protein [Alphaproteobacteria bacterium]